MICPIIYSHLSEIDSKDLDEVYFNHALIRCILYADDLVLFSFSTEGLQRQLDRLLSYWKLLPEVGIGSKCLENCVHVREE